jgi:predicted O-linked N-acetylglucosamine transferase (SPINDLY family)
MSPDPIHQSITRALELHRAGRAAEAETIYRRILEERPDQPDALHFLGVLAAQAGDLERAIALLHRAVSVNPAVAEFHGNLGLAYCAVGQWDAALASFRRAIAVRPGFAQAHSHLGDTLDQLGRVDEAIDAYRRALECAPDYVEAHNGLGNALRQRGRLADAAAAYERAVALRPGFVEALNNLGNARKELGRPTEAVAAYERALRLMPEAAEIHSNLGVACSETGDRERAIEAYRRAIALKPELAAAHANLGAALGASGQLDEAEMALCRAIELEPRSAAAHGSLGSVHQEQGRLDDALASYRRAVALGPDDPAAASNLLYLLQHHADYDARAILAEHRQWARRFAGPLASQIRPHANDPAPDRKLRIGYLSPDFRDHPLGRLILPLFAAHDPHQTEIIAYSDVRAPDAITARLQALATRWSSTAGMSDQALADRVRTDGVDILVDLSVHMAGSRLLVFARKPAPVQVSMFGMPATTGLETIDYRLTDPYLDPPALATDGDYAERSIRLPHCYWCYEPPAEAPLVGALPALHTGFVTFGCLNRLAKVTPEALLLWRTVLRSVPRARLVLQAEAGSHRERVLSMLEQGGVARDRIEFVARASRLEYFQRFHSLDISLDPFPYNGHTSTLDSLWMGVPVVSLAGRTAVARGGVSILSNASLPELIARTPDRYVEIARELSGDLQRLAVLRATLRERMRASPLVDCTQFAADLEATFRTMWKLWCAGDRGSFTGSTGTRGA